MDARKAKIAYDVWHGTGHLTDSSLARANSPWYFTVRRLLPDLNGARVLEIGCGTGDFSVWLARKYPRAEVTGIDFSETAITIASRRLTEKQPNLSFVVADAEDLRFPNASFDWVISCE